MIEKRWKEKKTIHIHTFFSRFFDKLTTSFEHFLSHRHTQAQAQAQIQAQAKSSAHEQAYLFMFFQNHFSFLSSFQKIKINAVNSIQ